MKNLERLEHLVQIAYVTNDLGRAIKMFRDRYGIEAFLETGSVKFAVESGAIMELKAALAYVGPVQWEIIEPVAGAIERYTAVLPADGSFAVRFHHLGFATPSASDLAQLRASFERDQSAIAFAGTFGECGFFYNDALDALGHHLEYIYMTPEYDRIIPRN